MNAELTLGKYHYWDEVEDDNIKRFHFMQDNNGKDHHIDFSPYYKPTEWEFEAVRKFVDITGRIPDRMDNNNHNFHKGDITKILESLCPCGNPICEEAYAHTTSGW
mgnify:CR=1 FL=1|jgi:hypothetical protein